MDERPSALPPLPPYFAEIFEALGKLAGFDARFARDGNCGGADVKHALKRLLAYLTGAAAGLQVANVFVPISIVRQYVSVSLRLPLDDPILDTIFKGGDKMRVPPAVTMLAAAGAFRFKNTIVVERCELLSVVGGEGGG
jgi:hypothetical protein